MPDEIKLDALKTEMLKNISKIEFRDFFARASKCSGNNVRILLIVKPSTYDIIAETPFLNQTYFEFLVEIMKDKIHGNMELAVKMPKSAKGDEGSVESITLGDELDLGDLDDLDDLDLSDLDGFDEEDETSKLTFLSTRKLKVLLVAENKDDYLCIRKWALSKVKAKREEIKILALDKDGMKELFEEEYYKILQKSMEQKRSVVNIGMDRNSEEFKKFSEIMISLKESMSPNEGEINSFIDFMLVDEALFVNNDTFNLKAFETIPNFIMKNFGPLTERIKGGIENKDEEFSKKIEVIKKTMGGIDDDKDLAFFILSEIVKDISFIIIKKLYLSNKVVENYLNETLEEFNDIMSILVNPANPNILNLRLSIKDIITPYLNSGWSKLDSFENASFD